MCIDLLANPRGKLVLSFITVARYMGLRQRSFIRALQHSVLGSEQREAENFGNPDKAVSPTYFST